MSSKARDTFEANAQDVARLLELHQEVGGADRGRRTGLEVLNKSGIVLMCAVWEAYIEDLAAEVVEHYVDEATPEKLPPKLRETIGKELKNQKDSDSPWKLAGRGWKRELKYRLKGLQAKRNATLNAPKAGVVDAFFEESIGIPNVSSKWRWQKMSIARAREKLDEFVTLRGDIAHRVNASTPVHKSRVEEFRDHVERLVALTDDYVNAQVRADIGKGLF